MKKNFETKEEHPIRLRYYFLGSLVLWSILIGLSLAWNLRTEKSGILEAVRIEARTAFDKDVVYRRWNASRGGVYAPVTEVTQPNPYLDVLERDITTSLGKELTKINPAYMTRQVHELALKAYGIRGHITSLNPIRPANAPDPWETLALTAFQTGLKEASSVEEIEGNEYMRLMRPLLTEKGCLKCHAAQGYKLGDIRGGISVSIPMAPRIAITQSHILGLCVGHGLLWLAGLVGIGFAFRRLNQQIHKRMGVEEALRESEAQKKAILDGITSNLAFVNENLEVLWANKAAADSINRNADEVVGHKCHELWADPETPCVDCPTVKAFKTQRSEQTIMQTPDGRTWHEKGEPVFDENGKIVGVLEIAHDITEKLNAEEALRASEEKLARAKKMESLGLMAGGIAHDLNNILSGIVSYPELLLMDLPEDSPMWKPIKTIQESGMRAADVVEDLLTIAKGVATSKEVLNLNAVVTEYLNSAEYEKLEKTHSFVNCRTELDPDLLNMSGSPTHIKKILMNLVANASEAIEGSGTVAISTANQYLDEPLKGYEDVRIGEYAVLSVSDDGSGISPEDLERIFEPFYTKKMMGRSGTGLGLAVVWNSMQDHDGYINVKSSDKGTIFELYFPVTRDEVAAEGEEVPLEDYLGHGEKILVVDDEENQREIAGGILTKLGYNAESVSSGEAAIEYVRENPVDLIVLDMVMPQGINGRKTYGEIIKIRPKQKAIIASGYAKTKEVELAQELGAGKYIKKPYTLGKVGLAVKEELEQRVKELEKKSAAQAEGGGVRKSNG